MEAPRPQDIPPQSSPPDVPTEQLIAQLYEELRKLAAVRMARERDGHTLSATSLVHEVYLRLQNDRTHWANKAQFFSAAAEIMKRALIDHARRRATAKRGGGDFTGPLDSLDIAQRAGTNVLELDHELDLLRTLDPEAHQIVMLRFFAGLRIVDIAAMLGITDRTAKRRWQRARLLLLTRLTERGVPLSGGWSYSTETDDDP
ncbi:MAG: sigma-70 family RNA polymerase sigma factor [Phycisphaerae bacterium]|nr:sigma-70 family RNA polymerase sigma factor [Phycisphaerae bacterium]